MTNLVITLENAKGYKTQKNLDKALERTGLDTYGIRYILCNKPDGSFTAIFLVSEWSRTQGGYIGIASQYGFMSV